MEVDAREISELVGGTLVGENVTVDGVDSIDRAADGDLTFLSPEYDFDIRETEAEVVICSPETPPHPDTSLIRVSDPRFAFTKAMDGFFVKKPQETEVHPTAVVEDGAEIGDRTYVGPFVYVHENVSIGERCVIHAGTVVGTRGSIDVRDENGKYLRRVEKGSVEIGDHVVVGANAVVMRAAFKETVIGDGTRIGNQTLVPHNAQIGTNVGIMCHSYLGGSTVIEERAMLYPGVKVAEHTTIGGEAVVGMNSTVLDDVKPGETVAGNPARPIE